MDISWYDYMALAGLVSALGWLVVYDFNHGDRWERWAAASRRYGGILPKD